MKYTPEYKAFLAKNNLFTYDSLSPSVQEIARANVIEFDQNIYNLNLQKSKALVKSNIHYCINDRAFLAKLIQKKKLINRLLSDQKYLIGYIEENLIEFDSNGTQKLYYNHVV